LTIDPTLPAAPEPPSGAALRALARAVELTQSGRLDDAETVYAKLLAQAPRDPTVLINAGVLALSRGDVAGALARLARGVEVVPSNAIAHGNLGFALLAAGRAGDALAALGRAVAIKPDFAQAHNNRGIALERLGRRAEARASSIFARFMQAITSTRTDVPSFPSSNTFNATAGTSAMNGAASRELSPRYTTTARMPESPVRRDASGHVLRSSRTGFGPPPSA